VTNKATITEVVTINRLNDLDGLDPRLVLWALHSLNWRSPEELREFREARARVHKARLAAEICGKCGRALGEHEVVYITRAKVLPTRTTRWLTPVCEGCAPVYVKDWEKGRDHVMHVGRIFPRCPCEECGRVVVFDTTPALWRRRKHVLCSQRCKGKFYKRARSSRAGAR
jgi:hypothetical protein